SPRLIGLRQESCRTTYNRGDMHRTTSTRTVVSWTTLPPLSRLTQSRRSFDIRPTHMQEPTTYMYLQLHRSSVVSSIGLYKAPEKTPSTSTSSQTQTSTPVLVLKPHINFKALANPETAAIREANIKNRNLPSSVSVAAINKLYSIVMEKTQQLDKARAER